MKFSLKTSGIKRNKQYGMKLQRKAGRLIKKRYFKPTGMKQLVRDVALVKSVINAEKKIIEYSYTNYIGQCNINADTGWWAQDITPTPAQGNAQNQRSGASIKLTSTVIRAQFVQMTQLNTDLRFKVFVIKTVGQPNVIDATAVSKFLKADVISTMTDFNSNRNPDYFRDFVVVSTKVFKIVNDSATSQNQIRDIQLNLKHISHHVRTSGDSQTLVASGQLWLLIVSDTGNTNTVSPSTLTNVANKATATGSQFFMNVKHFYYDN